MHVTVDFCNCLECVYVKYKSRASTARELPDKYLGFAVNSARHGFFAIIIFIFYHLRSPLGVK